MRKLILLAMTFALGAFAQEPGMFPWWNSPIARDLNLTTEQRQQIRSTVQEYREQMMQQRAAVQKAETRLRELLNEEYVDEFKAVEAIDQLVAARADLTRTVSLMGLKLRTVLTPQQWQELEQRRGAGPPRPGRGVGPGPRRGTGRGPQF
jgi:Spy/CpxP family protein refolding chaperone